MDEITIPTVAPDDEAATEAPLSQSEFRSTPYRETEWEVVGERAETKDFAPLEMSILPQEIIKRDMFASFGESEFVGKEISYHGTVPLHATREEIEERIDEIVADLNARHQIEIEKAKQESHRRGIAEGETKIFEHYSGLSEKLKGITDQVAAAWIQLRQEQEKKAYQLAVKIAEKVLHTAIEIQPEYIVSVIKAGVEALGASKPLRIRVSPQDFEFLKIVGLPPELGEKELGAVYVADEEIKGGCVIESSFGEVNMLVDRMWSDIHTKLQGGAA